MNSKRVAFYIRSATGNEANLQKQEKLLRHKFVRQEVDSTRSSVNIYTDRCSSGLRAGPDLLRLQVDIAAGASDLLALTDLTRISRNPKEIGNFLESVRGKCRVVSFCGFDSASPKYSELSLAMLTKCRAVGGINV